VGVLGDTEEEDCLFWRAAAHGVWADGGGLLLVAVVLLVATVEDEGDADLWWPSSSVFLAVEESESAEFMTNSIVVIIHVPKAACAWYSRLNIFSFVRDLQKLLALFMQ